MAVNDNVIIMPPEVDTAQIHPFVVEYLEFSAPKYKFNKTSMLIEQDGVYTFSLPTGGFEVNYNTALDVGVENITGIKIQIKSIITEKPIKSYEVLISENIDNSSFELTDSKLIVRRLPLDQQLAFTLGQYYKIQLAFITGEGTKKQTGYFSSPFTCISVLKPVVQLEYDNQHVMGKLGTFYEGLESSYYILKDVNDNIIQKGKEQFYKDKIYNQFESTNLKGETGSVTITGHDIQYYTQNFDIEYELDFLQPYTLEWHYKLGSGYKDYISRIILNTSLIVPQSVFFNLSTELDRDNGLIEIYMNKTNEQFQNLINKTLVFYRSDSDSNYKKQKKIGNIRINNSFDFTATKTLLFKDLDVEFGKSYMYSCEIIDNNLNSFGYKFKTTFPITVWFDDSFLFDEERQFCFAYNPKISSFKATVKDMKIETIGAQHPFFYRNEIINYKEFQISGLISYLQDKDQLFMNLNNINNNYITSLSDENILKEKLYKIEIYNWLNNGKPKKLKTPTEGNFTVRLNNVSLTPNDTLGRMLHTFNATATEINSEELNWGVKQIFQLHDNLDNFPLGVYEVNKLENNYYTTHLDNKNYLITEIIIANPQFNNELIGELEWIYSEGFNSPLTGKVLFTEAGLRMAVEFDCPIQGVKTNVPCEIWLKGRVIEEVNSEEVLKLNVYNFDSTPNIVHKSNYKGNIADMGLNTGYYKTITFISDGNTEIKYKDILGTEINIKINKQLTLENIYMDFNIDCDIEIEEIYGVVHNINKEG